MSFLSSFLSSAPADPYEVGAVIHFLWKGVYYTTTEGGFKVKYTLACNVDKVDHKAFKQARMLDTAHQQKVIDEWHKSVFLPRFKQLGCSFRLLADWSRDWNSLKPCFCRALKEGQDSFVAYDFNVFETSDEFRKLEPYRTCGCEVRFFFIEPELDESLIEGNCNMIKICGLQSPENTPAFKTWEESVILTFAHRYLALEHEFQRAQTNQEHGSSQFSVKTQLVGRAVELSWDLGACNNSNRVLRGYRREGGFTTDAQDLASNGTCVVETRTNGRAVQNLKDGAEYFYTFLLTSSEPVYEDKTIGDAIHALLGKPRLKEIKTRVHDSLRFSVRIPTTADMLRIQQLLETAKKRAIDPKRERINHAIEELTSFVEFEESLSQMEKDLVKRIQDKGYSPEERAEKIDRLRALVASLGTQV